MTTNYMNNNEGSAENIKAAYDVLLDVAKNYQGGYLTALANAALIKLKADFDVWTGKGGYKTNLNSIFYAKDLQKAMIQVVS